MGFTDMAETDRRAQDVVKSDKVWVEECGSTFTITTIAQVEKPLYSTTPSHWVAPSLSMAYSEWALDSVFNSRG